RSSRAWPRWKRPCAWPPTARRPISRWPAPTRRRAGRRTPTARGPRSRSWTASGARNGASRRRTTRRTRRRRVPPARTGHAERSRRRTRLMRGLTLAGVPIVALSVLAAPPPPKPVFVDVTAPAGLSWTIGRLASGGWNLVETMGGGGGFVDFDGDGRL